MNPAPALPLADIHLAQPVSAWPPAIGWWLVALLVVSGIALLCYRLYRRRQAKVFSREAHAHLQQQSEQIDLQALNELLKIVAMHYSQDSQLAGLTGSQWHQWLLSHCRPKQLESLTRLITLLKTQQYSDKALTEPQQQQMVADASLWLKQAWRLNTAQAHKERNG